MKGLHIFGLSHGYGKNRILNDVALVVPAGELVCLLGPSGCGKSTILRLAAGLEPVQSGSIIIDDEVVASADVNVPPEHRHVGFMFQDYALFPHLTVLENVAYGLIGMSPSKARARALDMLGQVGMADRADDHPHMLSGGQQQRVALARALAPGPKVLLLDEPFSGLDTNMRQTIREETLSVLKKSGVATLMVTHDPEEAMFMADRIKVVGRNGRILQAGRPHDIYYHPTHAFVASLFGMMNRIDGIAQGGQVKTPLGAVATRLADGTAAKVLIRPEGIILETDAPGAGTPVDVTDTHMLGHDNIVRVCLPGRADKDLYVRVHRTFEAELHTRFSARLDADYAFVFAAADDHPGDDAVSLDPGVL